MVQMPLKLQVTVNAKLEYEEKNRKNTQVKNNLQHVKFNPKSSLVTSTM